LDHEFLFCSQIIESLKDVGLGLLQRFDHSFVVEDVLFGVDDCQNLRKMNSKKIAGTFTVKT
jgi:hypothetical protein